MMNKATSYSPTSRTLSNVPQYVTRMRKEHDEAIKLFPCEAPNLDPSSFPDNVVIPHDLWQKIYGVMRLYPAGIELKQLVEDFVCYCGTPLGGPNLYSNCHVKTLDKLLMAIPHVLILEIKEGTIGYRLKRDSDQFLSFNTKNKRAERIRRNSTAQRATETAEGSYPYCSDDDLEAEEYDSDSGGNSILQKQPQCLLSSGTHVPESIRRRTHKLLLKKFPLGLDIVTLNERYQQKYKQCINPTVSCNMDMQQMFRAMSDILHIGYGATNLMYIKAKTLVEIKNWRFDAKAHAATALSHVRMKRNARPVVSTNDKEENAETVFKQTVEAVSCSEFELEGVSMARDLDHLTNNLNNLCMRDDDRRIVDALYEALKDTGPVGLEVEFVHALFPVNDPVRGDIQAMKDFLPTFLKRYPKQFLLYFDSDGHLFVRNPSHQNSTTQLPIPTIGSYSNKF